MPLISDFFWLFTRKTIPELSEATSYALLLTSILIAAFFFKKVRLAVLRPLENYWIRLAPRESLCIAIIGICALALNAFISLCGRIPVPGVHDEFSYLLASDTFASGRITNPTPYHWIPFESFHIIMQPTYASKYPSGQGAMLAIGQVLTGAPYVGSWLGTAFACMAIGWMLYRWLPPRWAFLGGLLACIHPAMIYWTQSYWGCQYVIAGSALAMGGLRIFLDGVEQDDANQNRAQSTRVGAGCGWIIGIGMSFMLLTRPFESAVLTLLILGTIAALLFGRRRFYLSQTLPILLCLVATVGFQAYYNFRVTGSARTLPYHVHEKTYGVSPLFIWERFKPEPVYRHEVLRESHVLEEAPGYIRRPTARNLFNVSVEKLMRFLLLHTQLITLALSLVALPLVVMYQRKLRLPFAFLLLLMAAILFEVWLLPHYTTALVPLGLVLSMAALRRLRTWRWHGRYSGLFLVRASLILSFLSVVSSYAGLSDPERDGIIYAWPRLRQFAAQREQIKQELGATPPRDLVIVRYSPKHDNALEWVFNEADIENAPVAWARAMTPEKDQMLAEYFAARGHRIWKLEADARPPRLEEWGLAGK